MTVNPYRSVPAQVGPTTPDVTITGIAFAMDVEPESRHSNIRGRKVLMQRVLYASAICVSTIGLVRVAQYEDLLSTLHFLQYVPPMIFFSAALLSSRLNPKHKIHPWDIFGDTVAIAASGSRMIYTATPFSGHMVLLTYGVMSSSSNKVRLFVIVMLIHTTFLKLIMWGDYSTWLIGAGIGFTLSAIVRGCKAQRPIADASDV